MLLNFRLKLYNFFKKNKFKIYIIIIVVAVIVAINIYLGKMKEIEPPSTNYQPHTAVISGGEVKSTKVKKNIETLIEEYVNYCNSKDYESAYNMLTDECKEYKFENKFEMFKEYIDYIFIKQMAYSIQDYSNKDNIYIYNVTISEDILATGMNNDDSDIKYEEKMVITKEKDDYKLSVGGFIKSEDMQVVSENNDMKIYIDKVVTFYDKVIYTIRIKNNTDYVIMLEREGEESSIGLSLNGDMRSEIIDNYGNNEKVIYPGNTKTIEISFSKFFDETREATSIIFNKVRILKEYTGVESLWEKESQDQVDAYSATIVL